MPKIPAGIEITARQIVTDEEPALEVHYRPRVRERIVEQRRAIMPISDPRNVLLPLSQLKEGKEQLEELLLLAFNMGRRYEFIILSGKASKKAFNTRL
jgi:hypothetical protein